jgi:phage terminase large subunit-like protein
MNTQRYFNECSDIPYSSVLVARTRLAQLIPGLRQRAFYDLNPGGSAHWTNQEFGLHVDPLTRAPLSDPENYKRAFLNPADNAANLTPEYLASLANLPEKQRKRFYEGAYINEVEGALWTYEQIERARISGPVPQLKRIVVAVDPSGAVGKEDKRSDEIGIVVCGLTPDGIGYVLEDCSVRDGPAVWGRVAVAAYHRWKADAVVAEINYGGAMVEFTLKAADDMMPVTVMTGSRGKHVRAEPVATLYPDERGDGRIRHWGRFPELEDQLTNFSTSGYVGERSPDRADAMV